MLTTTPAPMYAGGDYRTGMALPFGVGQTWTLTSGPHGWGGTESPYSSVDLAGGDQVVRAARAGTAYTMCQGWIRVIHDRGYSTDYYHLWNSISVNGAGVGQGAVLGNTGTDVTCGGAAYGRHVHFGLRQNSAYVPIAGHDIGKWVLANGAAAYQGGARHGSAWAGAGAASTTTARSASTRGWSTPTAAGCSPDGPGREPATARSARWPTAPPSPFPAPPTAPRTPAGTAPRRSGTG